MRDLLADGVEFDAVFTFNDTLGLGAAAHAGTGGNSGPGRCGVDRARQHRRGPVLGAVDVERRSWPGPDRRGRCRPPDRADQREGRSRAASADSGRHQGRGPRVHRIRGPGASARVGREPVGIGRGLVSTPVRRGAPTVVTTQWTVASFAPFRYTTFHGRLVVACLTRRDIARSARPAGPGCWARSAATTGRGCPTWSTTIRRDRPLTATASTRASPGWLPSSPNSAATAGGPTPRRHWRRASSTGSRGLRARTASTRRCTTASPER